MVGSKIRVQIACVVLVGIYVVGTLVLLLRNPEQGNLNRQDPKNEPCQLFIAVVVVSHNNEKYLAETVESVISQTWSQWELVIVDQGSSDRSGDIATSYAKKYPNKIRFVSSRFSHTPATARNVGITIASGNYILPLDGDDILTPGALKKYAMEMCFDPFLDAVVGYNEMFGNLTIIDSLGISRIGKCEPYDPQVMIRRNQIMNSCLFKRSVWAAANHYSEVAPAAEDWMFWWDAGRNRKLKVKCISEIVLLYRQTGFSRNSKSLTSNGITDAALKTMDARKFSIMEIVEAHGILAQPNQFFRDHVKRTIASLPNSGIARLWKAMQLKGEGKVEKAKKELDAAKNLNFLPGTKWQLHLVRMTLPGDYETAKSDVLKSRPDAKNLPLMWPGKIEWLSNNEKNFSSPGNMKDWIYGVMNGSAFVQMDDFNEAKKWWVSSDPQFSGALNYRGVSHPSLKHCSVQRWLMQEQSNAIGISGVVSHWGGGGDGVLVSVVVAGKTVFDADSKAVSQEQISISIPFIPISPQGSVDLVTCAKNNVNFDSTSWNVDVYKVSGKPGPDPNVKETSKSSTIPPFYLLAQMLRHSIYSGEYWAKKNRKESIARMKDALGLVQFTRRVGLREQSDEDEFNNICGRLSHYAYRLGMNMLEDKANLEDAMTMLEISTCALPSFAYAYMGLSLAHQSRGDRDKAVEFYKFARGLRNHSHFSVSEGLRKSLEVEFAQAKNIDIKEHGHLKIDETVEVCPLRVDLPLIVRGAKKRKFAVLYAHLNGGKLGPKGTFYLEVLMIQNGLLGLGYDTIHGSVAECVLGHSSYFKDCKDRQWVVFAAAMLGINKEMEQQLPPGTVLIQSEQITGKDNPWITDSYLEIVRNPKYRIWDYSTENKKALVALGVGSVEIFTYGYIPQLSAFYPTSLVRDVDVVFFGLMHERRFFILEELEKLGYNCMFLEGVYGWDRNFILSRSKIAVNIHYYSSKVTESNRIFMSLMSGAMVVSETGKIPAEDEIWDNAGVVFTEYDNLVSVLEKFLKDPSLRGRHVSKAVPALNALPFYDTLRNLTKSFDAKCAETNNDRFCSSW